MAPSDNLPPFPDDVPTHPLLVVDYELIKKGDQGEIDKLWEAATKLGFWYLKNHGVDAEADAMFEMGAETMALPLEEKMKFEQGDDGMSFGYKAKGATAIDETGKGDSAEFMNIAKDDVLAYPTVVHRTYPATVNARMARTVRPFHEKSIAVNTTLLAVFNAKLGLPAGALAARHRLEDRSCSESRCIKSVCTAEMSQEKVALTAHTDFGSLSFLHNRLGGLQVFPPDSKEWYYIKPIPGHAICNIGDALALLSGGILRSNIHRVVAPPKDQAAYERWSLVFFLRPANDVTLRALSDESPLIADAVAKSGEPAKFNPGQTAQEWFFRRNRGMRTNVIAAKGPEAWRSSRGTEHRDDTVHLQGQAQVVAASA